MIDYRWWDCSAGFKCPECGEELVVDNDDWSKCDCGAFYMLEANLITKQNGVIIKLV
jgi:transcription initiation factor IIE alpha subunit